MAMTMAPSNPSTAAVLEAATLHLSCKQPDLVRGLSMVSRAVLAHSTRPILKNILLATDRGRLRLSATNLEIGIQVWVDATQITGEGVTAVPADLLTSLVGLMPKETIDLSVPVGSQTLHMQCAGSVTNLRGQDPREFPVIPEHLETSRVIDAGLLKKMIEQVAFAADTMDVRPILTAVYMQIGERTLICATASPFRVVERIAPLSAGEPLPPLLVPARNLMELARILPGSGDVQIMIPPQQNEVIFHCDQGERIDFVSRLISGSYPRYQDALPRQFTTKSEVETKKFAEAVACAAVFARDEFKTGSITIKPAGEGASRGTITVRADDADTGNNVSPVYADVTGPERQIIFPLRYLAEALARIETPQVVFSVIDPGRPGVLKPVSDVQYTSMVMSAVPPKTPPA